MAVCSSFSQPPFSHDILINYAKLGGTPAKSEKNMTCGTSKIHTAPFQDGHWYGYSEKNMQKHRQKGRVSPFKSNSPFHIRTPRPFTSGALSVLIKGTFSHTRTLPLHQSPLYQITLPYLLGAFFTWEAPSLSHLSYTLCQSPPFTSETSIYVMVLSPPTYQSPTQWKRLELRHRKREVLHLHTQWYPLLRQAPSANASPESF